jgi:hypothetical protein
MTRAFIILFFLLSSLHGTAQSVKGSWYGRADVMVNGNASNYLTEMVLKQKGNDVEGIFGYYFKDSYQTFFIRGTFDPKTRIIRIRNIPLLFYASPTRTGIECPMHFAGRLMVSKVSSTLKGNFYTDKKYQYTCPELSVSMTMDASENQDSALDNPVAGKKFWQPQKEDVVVNAANTSTSGGAVATQQAARFDSAANDTIRALQDRPALQQAVATQEDNHAKLVEEFVKRNHIYEKDIVVYDDSILVSFYDNGDIDDDTISVFLNRKPILARRGLSSRALNIYIGLDSTIKVHELSMFADNLGKYPPNTALMVITDRQKRYELYLSASLKQNASIRLRRPR